MAKSAVMPDFIPDAEIGKYEAKSMPDFIPDAEIGKYAQEHVDVSLDYNPPAEKPGFLGGVAETLLPSWEGAKGMGQAAMDIASGKPGSPAATALLTPHIEQFKKAHEALQQGRYSEAAGYLGAGLLPFVGPAAATAGERIGQGEPARGLGNAVGLLAPFGASAIAKPALGLAGKAASKFVATPEDLYASALKPSTTYSEATRTGLLKTGMREGIPVTKKGLGRTSDMIKQLQSDIEAKITAAQEANPEAAVDPARAATRVDEPGPTGIRSRYEGIRKSENKAAIDAVQEQFLKDFQEPISLTKTQEIKKASYRDLGERAYEKRVGAGAEAEKQIIRGLKEELESFVPELKEMNAREGALIQFQKVLRRAVAREKNHQWFGIGTPLAATAGSTTGLAVGALMGGVEGAGIGGTLGSMAGALKYFLDKPSVKSSLSILMNRVRQVREARPEILSGGKVLARNLEVLPAMTQRLQTETP